MCLTPCLVASEFSILRATSVSSWAGDAPGSEATTVTVGSSMSGKFWIFIALKLTRPTSVSMMNSSTPGMGLRMDQEETFIMVRVSRSLLRRRGDHLHEVAVGQEPAAARDHLRIGRHTALDLDAVAHAAPHLGLELGDLLVGAH